MGVFQPIPILLQESLRWYRLLQKLNQRLQNPIQQNQSLDTALDVVASPLNPSWVSLCLEMILPGFTILEPEN